MRTSSRSSVSYTHLFIGIEPDGQNINKGVGSTHLENLEKAVVEGGFDCGIAFDGEADRCLGCDEKGHEMDGDKIIADVYKRQRLNGLEKGKVKLGVFNSVCASLLPGLLKSFMTHYPQIEIEVYQRCV